MSDTMESEKPEVDVQDTEPKETRPESPVDPVDPVDPEPLPSATEGDTKGDIRNKVWKYLESNNLASFPRPVKNRIPNYKGSAAACDKGTELDVFVNAKTIKINPDKPQEQARFKTLEAEKTLLVPTPRLRRGLFNKITPPNTSKGALRFCSTSQGVRQHSIPLGLDMEVKVDLVIVGSVAVSPSGLRIGKGEGFADMEYGMMASMGAVDDDTIVVTTVHDCQVMDLPEELFGPHDITIDYICTPTQVIECSRRPKPKGIIWSILGLEKFKQIPILKILRDAESREGKSVTLAEEITEEELEAAIEAVHQQDEEQERERQERDRPPRRRNRRFRPRRERNEDDESGQMVNGSGLDGDHADGEDSPSGEQRRRQNNNRRRRERRRTSERQNSEGEPYHEGEEGSERFGGPRRRRPRRTRRPRNEQVSGDDGDMQDGKTSPEVRGEPRRRPRRNRRPRNRSEGDRGEEGDSAQHDSEQMDRRPQRFTNRRRPRNYSNRDGREQYGDSPGRDGTGSPGDGRPRRDRPRRMNNLPSVYIGSLPKALRVSDFKKQVRDKDVNPLRVLWRGTNGHVFIMFQTMEETEDALRKLENLSINEKEVKVALANRTERRLKTGSPDGDFPDDDRNVTYSTGSGDTRTDVTSQGGMATT